MIQIFAQKNKEIFVMLEEQIEELKKYSEKFDRNDEKSKSVQ